MNTTLKSIPFLVAFVVALCPLCGCASRGNPVAPGEGAQEGVDAAMEEAAQGGYGHNLWGMWSIRFDLEKQQVTVEPLRDPDVHYNVTDMLIPPACNDCVKIKVNSFDQATRILDADVTLRNPTKLTGYDVRGILYTNDYGLELRNADDWTGLYDIAGGEIINPFRMFALNIWNTYFVGESEQTENYLVYIPKPPHLEAITFAVDASFPDHCKEPYWVKKYDQQLIHPKAGSHGLVYVAVHDSQHDISEVTLIAPAITGESFTQLHFESQDNWVGDVTNNTGVTTGDYPVMIRAKSAGSGELALYDKTTITIAPESPFNLADVTSPLFSFMPIDICVDGNYAYATAVYGRLYIFDLSDPANPVCVNVVNTTMHASYLTVSGGYAYMIGSGPEGAAIEIMDVTTPQSAFTVKTLYIPGYPHAIVESDGYAYVDDYEGSYLRIIDVDPPEDAHLVNSVDTLESLSGIAVSGPYAYLANYAFGFQIVMIDPPEDAHMINTVSFTGAVDVEVADGYAYVANATEGLQIVDIDPPEAAYIVSSTATAGIAIKVALGEGYAYVGEYKTGVSIVDIDPPESAYCVNAVETPSYGGNVAAYSGYIFLVREDGVFSIIDANPPESAYLLKTYYGLQMALQVAVDGDTVCVGGDWPRSLFVANIDPLESAYFSGRVTLDNDLYSIDDIAISGGYAYIVGGDVGLRIVDIDPVESAYIAKSVDTGGYCGSVAVSGGYAYVTDGAGLRIIDIDPVESAYMVNTVAQTGYGGYAAVSGGYAYLAMVYDGLYIIDIDPPECAHIMQSVSIPKCIDTVAVSGSYAYVLDYDEGLQVIDVDPPENAYLVTSLGFPSAAKGVTVSGGYAFIDDDYQGVWIIDVNAPESPFVVDWFGTTYNAMDIAVSINYAYVADQYGGLRIIKLW